MRVLDATERVHGPDHLDTLTARSNLSFSYASAGRTDDANRVFNQYLNNRDDLPLDRPTFYQRLRDRERGANTSVARQNKAPRLDGSGLVWSLSRCQA